ncbi:PREDICTED: HSP-interacting protein-like [Ipomoea nil]|uniref:HSP-interacting protein-like n=1 Tax=Ipomoea nil TaxID=35883 RepID=UPI0009016CA2|nr:PREDICTED: HSP-interacting protein-like [Ipomoea nil]XP_019183847.1 PREDICTED: HSP-interacting protein-like [Ipomoea nil]XP_019183848.1 PREDICTED: HSP-interacting protein-like [Ipomoea nil]
MGKQGEKVRKPIGAKSGGSNVKKNKGSVNSTRLYDKDTAVFISMSQELKYEGNRLFQQRDYEGAMFKYEKAIKLLPGNHIDVSHLRSNMAACYMQMGLSEYPRAIHECNLALEVTPKYSKALLKRARCYEALNRLDLALRDVSRVLQMEPNNLMATEIADRVKKASFEQKGVGQNEVSIDLIPVPEYVEPVFVSSSSKASKEKARKVKNNKIDSVEEEEAKNKKVENGVVETKSGDKIGQKKAKNKNEEKRDEYGFDEMNPEEEVKVGDDKLEDGVHLEKAKIKNVEKANNKAVVNGVHETNAKGESEEKKSEDKEMEKKDEYSDEERKTEDKLVVEEMKSNRNSLEEQPRRMVKLIFGEDIRWAQIPINCTILELREIIRDRFPSSKSILIKYRDQEGDLVTITTNEELRWAEASVEHSSVRLYIVDVNPDQDPFFEKDWEQNHVQELQNGPPCIDDWIIHFAHLFKNYVGFECDTYLDLHEAGMELYSEAMEETVTSEEAQDLFLIAAEKFQEMAALALFNWGNVHMSRARKRVYITEDNSGESVLEQVKCAYVWAQKEYSSAGRRYEEALKIKPNFYEGILALGLQQFERAKLSWYYAISTNADMESWPSTEVFQLYNNAEENMERGMQMWEEEAGQHHNELSKSSKTQTLLQEMKMEHLFKDISTVEVGEQAANMRSQINLLWGSMLYERSIMEFKLGLPVWQESLEVAVEKFELAGASPTDIAVMVKSHCSNTTAPEGLGFNIDEIVQAWNEMYEARRWQRGVSSFRLEPLLRRRVSKLYHTLELA